MYVWCGAYWRVVLKEEDAYFKFERNIYVKFQNLLILSFHIAINN